MTLEEVGAYIKLLCFQADRGPLTEKDILKKIPTPIWEAIRCKFKNENGVFFNERLVKEVDKRRAFTASRRKNLHMESHMEGAMTPHMENENENRNKNKDNNIGKPKKKAIPPQKADVIAYCLERKNGISLEAFMNHYDSKGWVIGKTKMVDWKAAIRTWEQRDKPVVTKKPYVPPKPIPRPDPAEQAKVSDLISKTAKDMK